MIGPIRVAAEGNGYIGTMLRGSRKTRVNVPPRRPSERASSGGIDRAPRDAPRGEAPRGIPRCEVDPDTRAANEVGGGNIGPSLEGKLEASSLFTEEVIRTISHHLCPSLQQISKYLYLYEILEQFSPLPG